MARYFSRETEPYGRWKGIPIYLTTIFTGFFVLGLFASAFLFSVNSSLIFSLTFSLPGDFGEALAAFTYPFIERISFFSPFAIFFFYWLSLGIETHLGRPALSKLLFLLLLTPVVTAAALWFAFGIPTASLGGSPLGLSGTFLLSAALIIAFATLYPNSEWMGWVPFKWVAFACLLCGSLMQIAARDWVGLGALLASCAAAFLYIRHAVNTEYDDSVPLGKRLKSLFQKKPRLRVLPTPDHTTYRERPLSEYTEDQEILEAEMDALLDKIAKNGLASLSVSERKQLERGRELLLKKEKR